MLLIEKACEVGHVAEFEKLAGELRVVDARNEGFFSSCPFVRLMKDK